MNKLQAFTHLCRRLFDRSNDPVLHCTLYKDKSAGSCAHVDGPLCDFPSCSMLAEYYENQPRNGQEPNK